MTGEQHVTAIVELTEHDSEALELPAGLPSEHLVILDPEPAARGRSLALQTLVPFGKKIRHGKRGNSHDTWLLAAIWYLAHDTWTLIVRNADRQAPRDLARLAQLATAADIDLWLIADPDRLVATQRDALADSSVQTTAPERLNDYLDAYRPLDTTRHLSGWPPGTEALRAYVDPLPAAAAVLALLTAGSTRDLLTIAHNQIELGQDVIRYDRHTIRIHPQLTPFLAAQQLASWAHHQPAGRTQIPFLVGIDAHEALSYKRLNKTLAAVERDTGLRLLDTPLEPTPPRASDPLPTRLGLRGLRAAREARGLTLAQLAEIAGTRAFELAHYENGIKTTDDIPLPSAQKIAWALDTTIEALLTDTKASTDAQESASY